MTSILNEVINTMTIRSVTITAGHSNTDPGAVNTVTGDREADIALDMRNMLRFYLEREGVLVTTDGLNKDNQSLREAVKLVTNSQLAIEIHCNASSNPKAEGVEALAQTQDKYTAQQLCKAVNSVMHIPMRGQQNGWKPENAGQHSRLAYVSGGGIILEMFFISNLEELNIWKAKKWLVAKEVAAAILRLI